MGSSWPSNVLIIHLGNWLQFRQLNNTIENACSLWHLQCHLLGRKILCFKDLSSVTSWFMFWESVSNSEFTSSDDISAAVRTACYTASLIPLSPPQPPTHHATIKGHHITIPPKRPPHYHTTIKDHQHTMLLKKATTTPWHTSIKDQHITTPS